MQVEIEEKTSEQVEVVPIGDEHLEQAAVLFVKGYQQARRFEPLLPPCHEHAERMLPRLRQLSRRATGVAAMRDGIMVGFLLGQVMPDWRGKRAVYAPEWAHAAVGRDSRGLYQAMYAQVSRQWVADGCHTHLITLLADGRQVVDTFLWFGFGLTCVDAMRELCPAPDDSSGVDVRRAGPVDTSTLLNLASALKDHLSAAPVFLPAKPAVTHEEIVDRLADPAIGIFVACEGGEVVAYVDVRAANPSAAYIIDDPKTASIKAMYTRQECRGRSIGRRLLNEAIKWAGSSGYERLAVDFEPQNVPGSRFWLEHFRPVCYSMIRHIEANDG